MLWQDLLGSADPATQLATVSGAKNVLLGSAVPATQHATVSGAKNVRHRPASERGARHGDPVQPDHSGVYGHVRQARNGWA